MDLPVRYSRAIAAATLTLGVSACGTPPRNAMLEDARTRVSAIAQDPAVNRGAPDEVRRAREALSTADSAWSEGADEQEVNHRAYIAMQRAALAEETAKLHEAQTQTQNARIARESSQVVTLGNMLFQTGRAELTPGAAPTIDRLTDYLRQNPNATVMIEGYTDSTGSESKNLQLSQERADAVRSALIWRGIDPLRVRAEGRGDAEPVASNATAQGRQLNRRVEVVLTSPTTPPTSASGGPASPAGTGTFSPSR